MSNIQSLNVGYGLSQSLVNIFPPPILATRNPLISDQAIYGTIWINKSNSNVYILNLINSAGFNWGLIATQDTPTDLDSLTVTPGPISLTGTTTINVTGAASTTIGGGTATGTVFINNGGTGATFIGSSSNSGGVNIGGPPGTGAISIGGGPQNVSIGTGTFSSGIVRIGALSSASNVEIGFGVGGTTPTGNVSIGNLTGNVDLFGQLSLVGPVQLLTGAGAPASGLAVNVGDLYVNTTATTSTTRLYVATAAGTWTYFTAAA